MKISDLGQHCGDCPLIEYCGDAYYYCLCCDERFENMSTGRYKELADKIDWSDFVEYEPCRGCEKDCDGCEERPESEDEKVRYIADKVAEIMRREE
jgi:hypothetical protein